MKEEIKQRIETIKRGEIPKGYRKDNIFIIPNDDWQDDFLGNLGDFYKGKGLPGAEMKEHGLPCIGYGDIYTKYNFRFSKAQNFVSEEIAKESQPINRGTLLFTGSGETAEEIGKCICYDGDETIYAGGDIVLLNTEKVNPLFIAYQQNIKPCIKEKAKLGQGHSVVHIYADSLKKLSVAYPKDKTEQQRIVEILMKWDEAVAIHEKLIKNLEIKRKALIQKLLAPKKGWKKVRLGFVLNESSVTTKTLDEYPVISSTKNGLFYQKDFFDKEVASKDNIGYKILKKGQVVISPQNLWMGNINYNDKFDIGMVSPSYKIFYINKTFNKKFVSCLLKTERMFDQYTKVSEQGASIVRRNLNMELFNEIVVSLPNITEQDKIGKAISAFDDYYELNVQKLVKLKEQQKAIMQLLLTGIVRVNDGGN
jgi:type I restriction enzyme S subunit